jgi:nucleoside-diphosphate-sugar epimerase
MRVLVTGASGFIGRWLAAELESRGHEVERFDRPAHDVRLRNDVYRTMRSCGAVVNLAGILGTPELFGSELEAVGANITGAVNIYDAARAHGIPVVQIGTGHKGQPNPYAITKGAAEDLGLARARWRGEQITVVRAFHVYGEGQLPGAPWGPAPVHKFFPTFACSALTGRPLELCGGGTQTIDPVHVCAVAAALADEIGGGRAGQVVEAGCGKPFSVIQAAADIAAAADWPVPPVLLQVPPRDGEPEDAEVVARVPVCTDVWPHQVVETVSWYRQWLAR